MDTDKKFPASVFIRVHPWLIAVFVICFAFRALCADADYKQVLVFTNGDSIRVRLPALAGLGVGRR